MMTIKELAQAMNISVRTLQYYDEIDLVKPSAYEGRKRLYGEDKKEEVKQILIWKQVGLSLEEIQEVLHGDYDQEALTTVLERKQEEIRQDIETAFSQQYQIRDLLYQIKKSDRVALKDSELLMMGKQKQPYSFMTYVLAFFRNMTMFKAFIMMFYTLALLCYAALIGLLIQTFH